MTPTLPPERDLPPGRRAAIRDELVAAVTPRQAARRVPRWTAPVAVAAAVLAVVGVGAGRELAPRDEAGPAAGTAPTSAPSAAAAALIARQCTATAGTAPRPSPTAPRRTPQPDAPRPLPVVPGPTTPSRLGTTTPSRLGTTTPSRLGTTTPSRLGTTTPSRLGTTTPSRLGTTTPSPVSTTTPSPVAPAAPSPLGGSAPAPDAPILRNVLTDRLGSVAFLLGEASYVLCSAPVGGAYTGSAGAVPGGSSRSLGGPIGIDAVAAGATEHDAAGGRRRLTPESETVAGRVGRQVARVTVTGLNGVTATASVRDGTFLARIVHTPGQPVSAPESLVVRAYDAADRLLAEVDAYADPDRCDAPPDRPGPSRAPEPCQPAIPWP